MRTRVRGRHWGQELVLGSRSHLPEHSHLSPYRVWLGTPGGLGRKVAPIFRAASLDQKVVTGRSCKPRNRQPTPTPPPPPPRGSELPSRLHMGTPRRPSSGGETGSANALLSGLWRHGVRLVLGAALNRSGVRLPAPGSRQKPSYVETRGAGRGRAGGGGGESAPGGHLAQRRFT